MIWVFDSWFWWVQTLKYLRTKFPNEDFLFLADNINVPYGDKDKWEIRDLTVKNINWLFEQWCHHVVIACNTAVASIYNHWFDKDKEKQLISVTKCGVSEAIQYCYKNIAVFCTQATHDLQVYPTIYSELWGEWNIYTIPTPELVPLIEDENIDFDKIYGYISMYSNYLAYETDCLILWCTHYPILIDVFWEQFPHLKIIDPGRSVIFPLDDCLWLTNLKKSFGRWFTKLYCTGSLNKFMHWFQKIRKIKDYPMIEQVSI